MTRRVRDDALFWLEHGIDIPNRHIQLMGEINHDVVQKVARGIHILDRVYGNPRRPITLEICSGGGDTSLGAYLSDAILGANCPINTHASGEVCSVALPIFVSGSYRTATPSTRFMYHDASVESGDNASYGTRELKSLARELDRTTKWMRALLIDRTGLRADTIDQFSRGHVDWWFGVEEAENLQIVHEIRALK